MKISENVLMVILGVVLLYLLFKDNKEMMSNEKKTKACSQKSINEGYQYWVFGSQKFVR